MEETRSSVGFNKRRAEGGDKNDKPKNLQLKNRKLNPINTTSYVQILGTGMDTQDTSPSVLLFFDRQRFIFNAGEGLQRYCTEHKIKLSKIDHIFLSRVCSETAGGLPGLLLTLAAMGDEGMSVKIWGPSDLNFFVEAMRSFLPNAAIIHTCSFGPTTHADGVLINDEVVKISAILISPSSSVPKPRDISVIYVCELPEIKGKFDTAKAAALGLKPGPKYRELQLGNSVKSDKQNIMVHPSDVLEPSIRGPTVLLIDCPTLAHFQNLLSTQSLSCYYTDSVDHQPDDVKPGNCIIHLSPSSVTVTVPYRNWMKRFGGFKHIMAGHEIKNIEIPILQSSAIITARLNYLCPRFFPAPGFWSLQHPRNVGPDSSEVSVPKLCDGISAENLLKFHLRPHAQLGSVDRSGIPGSMSAAGVIDELLQEIPGIAESVEQVSQLWSGSTETKPCGQESIVMTEEPWMNGDNNSIPDINMGEKSLSASGEGMSSCVKINEVEHEFGFPSCLENITREDMEIVLLGTGSSQPSRYRNVSSIYVNLFSKGGLLLDCGEGSLGQLKRRFGVKGADDTIRSLRFIWISHIHADHHAGLARILSLRRELLQGVSREPLLVIGPRQLKFFLDAYKKLEDLDMQFLDCRHTTEASLASLECSPELGGNHSPPGSLAVDEHFNKSIGVKNMKKVLEEVGLEALVSVPVLHCPQAYGIVLKAAERSNSTGKTIPGWKLVYSGDTRPCQELIDASRGATVLIHEATFEDGMIEDAIAKNHSTTKEAIEVGNSAGAYRIILTHFSQRYPKIPVFDETHMHKTSIGFDLMSVNIADLPVLPKVLPYLKLLFRNERTPDEVDDLLGPLS